MCVSGGDGQGGVEALAAEFPKESNEARFVGPTGLQAKGGTTGVVATGPAMIAGSLEGTLTGKESQDSPCADMVRTVSS